MKNVLLLLSAFVFGVVYFSACNDPLLGVDHDVTILEEVIETENDRLHQEYLDSIRQDSTARAVRDSIVTDSIAQVVADSLNTLLVEYVNGFAMGCSSASSTLSTSEYTDRRVGGTTVENDPQNICITEEREVDFTTDAIGHGFDEIGNRFPGLVFSEAAISEGLSQRFPINNDFRNRLFSSIPGVRSVTMEGQSGSHFSDALSEMVGQIPLGTRFSPTLEVNISEFAYSNLHLRYILEGKGEIPGIASASAFLDLAVGHRGTTYVVVKGMNTFTASVDLPLDPSEIFDSRNLPPPGDCPVMLKNVIYGKVHIMIFQSDSVGIDFKERFSASANLLVASGSASLEAEQKAVLRTASIRTMTIGGTDPYTLSDVVPYTQVDIPDFTVSSSRWGADDYGVPLSFQYVYLDGTPFTTKKSTTFEVTNCQRAVLFEDVRTCAAGREPGLNAEQAVDLTGQQVMTGFAARVSSNGNTLRELRLQYRNLYADATLGIRGYKRSTENENPDYEIVWEAEDGYVVVSVGAGVRGDEFRTLKIVVARPTVDNDGRLKLVGHRTLYRGSEPFEDKVEAYCAPFTSNQVVTGIEINVQDSNIYALRVKAGIISY